MTAPVVVAWVERESKAWGEQSEEWTPTHVVDRLPECGERGRTQCGIEVPDGPGRVLLREYHGGAVVPCPTCWRA